VVNEKRKMGVYMLKNKKKGRNLSYMMCIQYELDRDITKYQLSFSLPRRRDKLPGVQLVVH
jgi:hypothetical protein